MNSDKTMFKITTAVITFIIVALVVLGAFAYNVNAAAPAGYTQILQESFGAPASNSFTSTGSTSDFFDYDRTITGTLRLFIIIPNSLLEYKIYSIDVVADGEEYHISNPFPYNHAYPYDYNGVLYYTFDIRKSGTFPYVDNKFIGGYYYHFDFHDNAPYDEGYVFWSDGATYDDDEDWECWVGGVSPVSSYTVTFNLDRPFEGGSSGSINVYESDTDYYFEVIPSSNYTYNLTLDQYSKTLLTGVSTHAATYNKNDLTGAYSSSSWQIPSHDGGSSVRYLSLPKWSSGEDWQSSWNRKSFLYTLKVSDGEYDNLVTVTFGDEGWPDESPGEVIISPERSALGTWNISITPESSYHNATYSYSYQRWKMQLPTDSVVSTFSSSRVTVNPAGPVTINNFDSDWDSGNEYGYYLYSFTVYDESMNVVGYSTFGDRFAEPPADSPTFTFTINGNSDFRDAVTKGNSISIYVDAYDPAGCLHVDSGFVTSTMSTLVGSSAASSTHIHFEGDMEMTSTGKYQFVLYHNTPGLAAQPWKTMRFDVTNVYIPTPTPTPSPQPTQVPWSATGTITASSELVERYSEVTITYSAACAGGYLSVATGPLGKSGEIDDNMGLRSMVPGFSYDPEDVQISGSFTTTISQNTYFCIMQGDNRISTVIVRTMDDVPDDLTSYSIGVDPGYVDVGESATFTWSGSGTGYFSVKHGWVGSSLYDYGNPSQNSITGSAQMTFDQAGRYKFCLYFNNELVDTAIVQVGVGAGSHIVDITNLEWSPDEYLDYVNYLRHIELPVSLMTHFDINSLDEFRSQNALPSHSFFYSANEDLMDLVDNSAGSMFSTISTLCLSVIFIPKLPVDMLVGLSDIFVSLVENIISYVVVPVMIMACVVQLIPDEIFIIAEILFFVDIFFIAFMFVVPVLSGGARAIGHAFSFDWHRGSRSGGFRDTGYSEYEVPGYDWIDDGRSRDISTHVRGRYNK